ncbi:MAG: hypothetical protein R3F02_02555 [Thiolinea sp.]
MDREPEQILVDGKPEVVAAAEDKAAEILRNIRLAELSKDISLQSMRGVLKGANADDYRDRRDRF